MKKGGRNSFPAASQRKTPKQYHTESGHMKAGDIPEWVIYVF